MEADEVREAVGEGGSSAARAELCSCAGPSAQRPPQAAPRAAQWARLQPGRPMDIAPRVEAYCKLVGGGELYCKHIVLHTRIVWEDSGFY